MFCGKCGAKIEDGDMFCPECGAKVEKQIDIGAVRSNVNQQPAAKAPIQGGNLVNTAKAMISKLNLGAILGTILLAVSFLSFTKPWIGFGEYTENQILKEFGNVTTYSYENAASELQNEFNAFSTVTLSDATAFNQVKTMMNAMKDAKLTPGEVVKITSVAEKWISLMDKGIQAQVKEYENNSGYVVDHEAADRIHTTALIVKISYYVQMVIYYAAYAFFALGLFLIFRGKKLAALPYTICVCLLFALWFAAIIYMKNGMASLSSMLGSYYAYTEEIKLNLSAYVCVITAILANVALHKKFNLNIQ